MNLETFTSNLEKLHLNKSLFAKAIGVAFNTIFTWTSENRFPEWVDSWFEIALENQRLRHKLAGSLGTFSKKIGTETLSNEYKVFEDFFEKENFTFSGFSNITGLTRTTGGVWKRNNHIPTWASSWVTLYRQNTQMREAIKQARIIQDVIAISQVNRTAPYNDFIKELEKANVTKSIFYLKCGVNKEIVDSWEATNQVPFWALTVAKLAKHSTWERRGSDK